MSVCHRATNNIGVAIVHSRVVWFYNLSCTDIPKLFILQQHFTIHRLIKKNIFFVLEKSSCQFVLNCTWVEDYNGHKLYSISTYRNMLQSSDII